MLWLHAGLTGSAASWAQQRSSSGPIDLKTASRALISCNDIHRSLSIAQLKQQTRISAAYQHQGDHEERDDFVMERNKRERSRFSKPEVRRALFGKNADDKSHKFGGSKNGSRVVPCHEDSDDSVVVSNGAKDQNTNDKDSEDLSLIRNQLSEIEKQQSSLLDLLQVCHLSLEVDCLLCCLWICSPHMVALCFQLICFLHPFNSKQTMFIA